MGEPSFLRLWMAWPRRYARTDERILSGLDISERKYGLSKAVHVLLALSPIWVTVAYHDRHAEMESTVRGFAGSVVLSAMVYFIVAIALSLIWDRAKPANQRSGRSGNVGQLACARDIRVGSRGGHGDCAPGGRGHSGDA